MADDLSRFDDILDSFESYELHKADLEANNEDRYVRKLVTSLKDEDNLPVLERMQREVTGDGRLLTFTTFYEAYPSFPVILTAKRIQYIHGIEVSTLFTSFTKTPFYKAFEEFKNEMPDAGCCGVVFNWPSLGTCVVHDYFTSAAYDGTAIVRKLADTVVIVERWQSFLDRING